MTKAQKPKPEEAMYCAVLSRPVYSMSDLLGVVPICRGSVYVEINEGRLRRTKIGRRTVFLADDVVAWLKGMRR